MTQQLVDSARAAHIFGAPLPANFWMSSEDIVALDATSIQTKIVLGIFVAISSLTTFLTVRQSVTRSMAQMPDNPMAQQQKILMYVSPLFAFFSLNFPLGLIMYWVTTNLWTLGQQHWFYSRNPSPECRRQGQRRSGEPKPSLLAQGSQEDCRGGGGAPAPRSLRSIRQQPTRQPRSKRTGSKKS